MPLSELCPSTPPPAICATPLQLSRELVSFVASLVAEGKRRHSMRIPLPFLLELEPVAASFLPPSERTVVVGKDISEAGIGFFHQERIPHRRVRLRMEVADLGPLELVVEMLWCRFTRQGWYESGARIVAIDAAGLAVARAG